VKGTDRHFVLVCQVTGIQRRYHETKKNDNSETIDTCVARYEQHTLTKFIYQKTIIKEVNKQVTPEQQQAIELARDYAEAIVETVREPLVVLDASLRVLTANRSFYRIFHVNKKDTEHKLIYELGNGQWDHPKLRFLLEDILPQKSFFQDFELEHEFPVIGKRIVCLNGRKIVQKNHNEPMILLAIEDITEKKMLEDQKDDFISIASHELKTPVTSMKVYSQLLQKHPLLTSDAKTADMLIKMDVQMNRLTELVSSFMNVYQIGTNKLRLHKTHFEFDTLLSEVVANFQYTVTTHFVEQHDEGSVSVFADRSRMNQVLVNLISNAIKYSPDAEKVVVKQTTDTTGITISVQDFGMGIPKNEQSRIYERFFRAKGKKEGKIPGLGLGLFISSEIVKQHGGKLWVDSAVGKGSTFYFTLPRGKTQ
jgi:signal transduction histidine kinase